MKRLMLIILFLLITKLSFAEVTAEIIATDIDANGNIRVKTQYKINNAEVQSSYPKEQGKSYFVSRYNIYNFDGMTKKQIIARIQQDIEGQCSRFIENEFLKKSNVIFNDLHKKDLIGFKVQKDTAIVPINPTTKWEVKDDGTKVKNIITNQ